MKEYNNNNNKQEEKKKQTLWDGIKSGFRMAIDPVGTTYTTFTGNKTIGSQANSKTSNGWGELFKNTNAEHAIGDTIGLIAGWTVDTSTLFIVPIITAYKNNYKSSKKPIEEKEHEPTQYITIERHVFDPYK